MGINISLIEKNIKNYQKCDLFDLSLSKIW